MNTERHCLKCRHCSVDFGEPDYSEYTPGHPAEFTCTKGHWALGSYSGSKGTLAAALETAKTCPDYEEESR
jgi:hypothetical protein